MSALYPSYVRLLSLFLLCPPSIPLMSAFYPSYVRLISLLCPPYIPLMSAFHPTCLAWWASVRWQRDFTVPFSPHADRTPTEGPARLPVNAHVHAVQGGPFIQPHRAGTVFYCRFFFIADIQARQPPPRPCPSIHPSVCPSVPVHRPPSTASPRPAQRLFCPPSRTPTATSASRSSSSTSRSPCPSST